MHRSTPGNRIYAVVKGMMEGGVHILCSNEILPTQERINGKDTKSKISIITIKEKIKWKKLNFLPFKLKEI